MKRIISKISLVVVLLLTGTLILYSQDTLAVKKDTATISQTHKKIRKLNPLKATMLAASLPGSGQLYTRKYWKVPLVYAGFGALGYAVAFNSKYYNTYTKAYQDFTDNIPETNSYVKLIRSTDQQYYDPVVYPKTAVPGDVTYIREQLLNRVDYFKRYRDLSLIGIGAWYLLTILDANVDASLFDYDVSENINVSLAPFQFPLYNYAVAGMNLTLTINF